VLLDTVRKRFGDGVKRLGSMGSSVMVGRQVGVADGKEVFVSSGVPLGRVPVTVAPAVLITNRFGVLVASNEKGVAVGFGEETGVCVCRKGMEMGSPLQPARRERIKETNRNLFITPLP